MRIPRTVIDMFDRAGRTTLQQFLVIAFAGIPAVGSVTHLAWYEALGVGVGAGVLSILMSLLSWKVPVLSFWPDVLVRMVRTFVQSLVASIGAGAFNVFTANWGALLTIALATSALSLASSLLVSGVYAPKSTLASSPSIAYDSTTHEVRATGKNLAGSSPTEGATPAVTESTAQNGS